MSRKNLNLKSTIFKIFIFYITIYFIAIFLRYSNGFENLIVEIKYRYLVLINIISIFLGLPLSILFYIIFIKVLGLNYIIFFAPILTTLGVAQIILLRKTNYRFSKNIPFIKNIRNHRLKHIFENITFKPKNFINIKSNTMDKGIPRNIEMIFSSTKYLYSISIIKFSKTLLYLSKRAEK